MNTDPQLRAEENRRVLQHDAVKGGVVDDVNSEIADRAEARAARGSDAHRLENAAGALREHAIDEAVESERAVHRSRGIARVSQFVDYAFFLVYGLLVLRFFLALIGARPGAGFVRFVTAVSDPLFAPFNNIVESPAIGSGGHVLLPAAIALFAYSLLHLAINRLLRVFVVRRTEI